MIGGIAGVNSMGGVMAYSRLYGVSLNTRVRPAAPETPVQPVRAVPTATAQVAQPFPYSYNETTPGEFSSYAMPVLPSSYAAEQANRARVEYPQGQPAQAAQAQPQQMGAMELPNKADLWNWPGANAAETLVRMGIQYGPQAVEGQEGAETGAVAAQEALEEGTCETCEKRKYQDGSDDSSVSYQSPTRIDPDMVASAVRGHEMEHVSHEQAKAQQEGRKVVSQTVTMHTDICPECGKTYISGGTTRTVTKAETEQPAPEETEEQAA